MDKETAKEGGKENNGNKTSDLGQDHFQRAVKAILLKGPYSVL